MRRLSLMLVGGALLAATAAPAYGQANAWQQKWYWGAQGGVFLYKTATSGSQTATDVGGHWLITGHRSALYLAYDQLFFPNSSATVTDTSGTRNLKFSRGRRLQAGLYAIPTNSTLQIYVGAGFAIEQITDATQKGTKPLTATQQATLDQEATKAFPVISGGFQLRMGRRWALFGTYQYMPRNGQFLITSDSHAITGGLRYALGSSHEDVTIQH